MCVGVCFVVVIRIRRIWQSLCLLVLTRDKNTSAGLCTCEIETPPRESWSGYEWKIVKFGEFNFDKIQMSREGAQDLQAMEKLVSRWFLWRVPGRESNPLGHFYGCSCLVVVRTTIAAAAAEESLTGVRIKFI